MLSMLSGLTNLAGGSGLQNLMGAGNLIGGGKEVLQQVLQMLGGDLGIQFGPNQQQGSPFSPAQNPQFGAPQGSFAQASAGPSGAFAQAGSAQGGGKGLLGNSPIGGVLNGATSVAKNLVTGKQPLGASVMVGVLQSIVGAKVQDPQQKANIQACLKGVQDGKPLQQCLATLSAQEKTTLADTIGSCGFEIPECLNEHASCPEQSGNSGRPDCALKTVEMSESGNYGNTLAGKLTAPLEMLKGLGGILG